MANTNQHEDPSTLDNLNNGLTNVGRQIFVNKSAIYVAFGALLVVAAATLCYIYFFRNPKNDRAWDAYNKVEMTATNDSVAAKEYKKVADEFGSTDAGKVAALSAAQAYYSIGDYKTAAEYLQKFKTKDEVLEANAKVLLGDCYVNLKKYDDAIAAYNEAVRKAGGNPQIVPRVLLKEANVYDEQKKYGDAEKCYQTIKSDFPEFQLGNGVSIDAYIEREQARQGK